MPISRRRFIFGSAFAVSVGGAFAYSRYIEPTRLSLERVVVELSSKVLTRPIKILQLTDLHYSSVVSLDFLEKAFDLGMSASPDLVCFTGDYITSSDLLPVRDLKPLLSNIGRSVPTFASLGNHDGGSWSAAMGGLATSDVVLNILEESHINVLRNSSTILDLGLQQLSIIGLEDLWSGNPDPISAFSNKQTGQLPTIVLSHNPDSKKLFADEGWDLALCGHTHGGQVVIPFVGAPIVPIRDKAFTAGLNEWRGHKIYTSRGIGSLYGLRFNCPPEVTLLELRPSV
jgi:predicted MPP superfamily phosphohydrolase